MKTLQQNLYGIAVYLPQITFTFDKEMINGSHRKCIF
jgi:hypothetical protein